MSDAPVWTWQGRHGGVRVRFAGLGPPADRETEVRRLLPAGIDAAWLRQVHSATVLDAGPGEGGPADALVSDRRGLGLAVATADCVPVLLAGEERIGAVHAGWRGIVAGIVAAAARRFDAPPAVAWIGPAIGPCCYEVGEDVASAVVAATSAETVVPVAGGRLHLDLVRGVETQLRAAGIRRLVRVGGCTRCAPDRLASYRRDGRGAGRNVAVVWRADGLTG